MSSLANDTEGNDVSFPLDPLVEAVDELDRSEAGDSEAASSFASGAVEEHEEIHVRDLIDFTDASLCRVIMTQKGTKRVCGNAWGACGRTNHNVLSQDDSRRATPAFYVAYQTKRGSIDGLANRSYTIEEVQVLREVELTAHATDLASLDNGEEEEIVLESESPAGGVEESKEEVITPFITPTRRLVPTREDSTGVNQVDTTPRQAPKRSETPRDPSVEYLGRAPPNTTVTRWYGVENSTTGDRSVDQDMEAVKFLCSIGWQVRQTFTNSGSASRWTRKEEAETAFIPATATTGPKSPPITTTGVRRSTEDRSFSSNRAEPARRGPELGETPQIGMSEPPPPVGGVFYGMENPTTLHRSVARARSDADYLKDSGYAIRQLFYGEAEARDWARGQDTRPLARPSGTTSATHQSKVGPDLSNTRQEVFGISIDMHDIMDTMCLPAGTSADGTDGMYDCATDVMALPGGFKTAGREDDEDEGDVAKALMTMASGKQEMSLHMRYNARSQNGLRQIKGPKDLYEFVENVHEAWQQAQSTMNSQITRRMYRAGYGSASISLYLQSGVLPRLITDTYTGYTFFLTTLIGYVNKMEPSEDWKDSVAGNFLSQHERALGMIRTSASCYRDLVLLNYTYMRDQARTSFWNDKLSKKMALVATNSMAQLVAQFKNRNRATGGEGNTGGGSGNSDCAICHRKHSGRPCAAATLNAAMRTRLGTGLSQRQYEKALRHIKSALAENPNMGHEGLVDAARQIAKS